MLSHFLHSRRATKLPDVPELTYFRTSCRIKVFRLSGISRYAVAGDDKTMSYAIIRTGGKQFPVTEGQTIRVPSIDAKEGSKVDIETLVAGEGKDAKIGGGATLSASIVGHGKGDKIIVFKKKRRKQYKRKQGHRQGYTEIKIEKI